MRRHDELAVLTVARMAACDRWAVEQGVPEAQLMEAAGAAVADAVQARWSRRSVTVLCGPGNNGGDGFVAARRLAAAGWPVRLAAMRPRDSYGGAAGQHARCCPCAFEPLSLETLDGAGLVIDALFGAGLARPLDAPVRALAAACRAKGLPVVAVDLPSGVAGDTGVPLGEVAFEAAVSVTFFRPKPAHMLLPGRALCGDVVVADIGIPAAALDAVGVDLWLNAPALWIGHWQPRGGDLNKYHFGHLLVASGRQSTGAARLAALAGLRIGAGLTTVAAPSEAALVHRLGPAAIMVRDCDGPADLEALLTDARLNALAMGPGLGRGIETQQLVTAALEAGRSLVLDADALTAFADSPETLFQRLRGQRAVLTPHDGEFARLFPDLSGDRLSRARAAADRAGCTVLSKGSDTVVASPDGRAALLDHAPPWLATAGTGDVLTGMIGGLLAQGLPPFEAAAAGAWAHAAAARELGPGMIADDLVQAIPAVLRALRAGETRRPSGTA